MICNTLPHLKDSKSLVKAPYRKLLRTRTRCLLHNRQKRITAGVAMMVVEEVAMALSAQGDLRNYTFTYNIDISISKL